MSSSPLPSETAKTVSFPEAMQGVIDGLCITKQEWGSPQLYAKLRDGSLMIKLKDGWHTWTISDGDMMGTDWVIF